MIRKHTMLWGTSLMLVGGVLSCDSDEEETDGSSGEQIEGCDQVFVGGEDDREAIQTALIEAEDSTTLCFTGQFDFTTDRLTASDKQGLVLRGVGEGEGPGSGAVFDFKDMVGPTGIKFTNMDSVAIENITVKNTVGDGIEVRGSKNVVVRKNKVTWERGADSVNGAYGLYPVESENLLIEDNEASYSADAGIYVGQSRNIIVRRNKVFGNVSGIQVENSDHSEVYENEAFENTAGIFVHDLPALPAGQGGRHLVRDNLTYDNNQDNFAPEGIAQVIPPGLGIMVLAVDDVELTGNEARDNGSAGILVVSFETVSLLDAEGRDPDPDYDPYPETIYIHDNTLMDNGQAPASLFMEFFGLDAVADLVWDGVADDSKDDADGSLDLCIQSNGAASFLNIDALNLGENMSDDVSLHDCAHGGIEPVDNGLG